MCIYIYIYIYICMCVCKRASITDSNAPFCFL